MVAILSNRVVAILPNRVVATFSNRAVHSRVCGLVWNVHEQASDCVSIDIPYHIIPEDRRATAAVRMQREAVLVK